VKINLKFWLRIISGLILCVIIFSGMAQAEPEKVVTVSLNSTIQSINMLEFKTAGDLVVNFTFNSGLMGYFDLKTHQRSLGLAKSVKILKNPRDIKVTLRDNLKFHSGDPVTAHDVKFTVEEVQNPANTNIMATTFLEIDEVEVVDDHTVIYHFAEPFAAWQEVMWMGICSKKYMEKVGKKKFRKHPIGVGPFKFVDRKVDEVIIFEPDRNNPEYNINFDRLEYRLVQDPVTRTAMLQAGELDLIYGIPPHQKKGLETNKNITVKKSSRVPSYFYLAIKPSLFPVIKDKNVRLAMNYAINRKEIIDRLYMTEGYPLYTFANVGELGFDSKIKYEYNPKKAASLLKNSSYIPGTPIRLSYTGMVPSGSQLASTVQHYLKEIGMTVELIELEWGTWITYSTSKDEKTAKKAGHMGIGVFPTHDPHIRMALSMRTGGPLCYYCNRPNQTKIDDLVEKQLQEMNIKKRISILKNIHEINFNDPGQVPLFGLNMIYAMNKRIDYEWNSSQMYLAQVEKIKFLE